MKKKIRTVGCFVENDGRFILLHRQPHKQEGDKWGLPAGKVDAGESDIDAVVREVHEETGILRSKNDFELMGVYEFTFPEHDVTFPAYRLQLAAIEPVRLSEREHQAYLWVSAEECYAMTDLIHGLHDLLVRLRYIEQH
jgi:mutator protein MutT